MFVKGNFGIHIPIVGYNVPQSEVYTEEQGTHEISQRSV